MIFEYFWLFLLIILLVLILDLFILLLDSYTIAHSVVVKTYILTIYNIIMKNSLFLWHLIICNYCCLLFILFKLKLIHSYTYVWSKNNLVNILVTILIVILVVYIPYYYFTINFSKTHFFFVILEYFWLFCLIILVLLLDLFILLLDSYIISLLLLL